MRSRDWSIRWEIPENTSFFVKKITQKKSETIPDPLVGHFEVLVLREISDPAKIQPFLRKIAVDFALLDKFSYIFFCVVHSVGNAQFQRDVRKPHHVGDLISILLVVSFAHRSSE